MPLKKSDDISKFISDFEKSNAPQFQGKSKEKRREMAIAAKLNSENVDTFKSKEVTKKKDGSSKEIHYTQRDVKLDNPVQTQEESEIEEVSLSFIRDKIIKSGGSEYLRKHKEELKKEIEAMKKKQQDVLKQNKMAEDVAQITEVSKETLKSYKDKAITQAVQRGVGTVKKDETGNRKYHPPSPEDTKLALKRSAGAGLASRKLFNKKYTKEEFDAMSVIELTDFIHNLPLNMQEEVKEFLGISEKRGLWDNIHAKRKRIKNGSVEEGAPSAADLKNSQKEETELEEKKGPCWTGHQKVPGKKDYEDDSCVKEEEKGEWKHDTGWREPDGEKKDQFGNTTKPKNVAKSLAKSALKKTKEMVKEDLEIFESIDKLMYLSRLGLVDKKEISILRKAMQVKKSGATIPIRYRDVMLKVMDKLIAMIMDNQQMFNKARRAVQEEVEIVGIFENILSETESCDSLSNLKEFREHYPNLLENQKSNEVESLKISEQYINYLNLVS